MPAQEVQCGQPGLRPEAAVARGTAMVLQPPEAGRRPPLHHPCTHTTPQRTRRVELGVAAVQVHAVDGPIHKLGRARILLVHRLGAGVARSACATPARCGALSEDSGAPCQAPDVRAAESLQGGCGSCGGGLGCRQGVGGPGWAAAHRLRCTVSRRGRRRCTASRAARPSAASPVPAKARRQRSARAGACEPVAAGSPPGGGRSRAPRAGGRLSWGRPMGRGRARPWGSASSSGPVQQSAWR